MLVKSCNADDPDFCDMRQWLCYGSREVGVFILEIPLVEKNVVKCPLQTADNKNLTIIQTKRGGQHNFEV